MRRNYLQVPPNKVDYALNRGAKLDPGTKLVYVEGDVPKSLETFIDKRPERMTAKKSPAPCCPDCNERMAQSFSKQHRRKIWLCKNPRCQPPQSKELPDKETLAHIALALPPSTMAKPTDVTSKSDFYRAASKAIDVLGKEHFESWLFGPNIGIGNLTPADLLGTKRGVMHVLGILRKLESDKCSPSPPPGNLANSATATTDE